MRRCHPPAFTRPLSPARLPGCPRCTSLGVSTQGNGRATSRAGGECSDRAPQTTVACQRRPAAPSRWSPAPGQSRCVAAGGGGLGRGEAQQAARGCAQGSRGERCGRHSQAHPGPGTQRGRGAQAARLCTCRPAALQLPPNPRAHPPAVRSGRLCACLLATRSSSGQCWHTWSGGALL